MIEWWEWLLIDAGRGWRPPRDPDDRRFILIAVVVTVVVGGFVWVALEWPR